LNDADRTDTTRTERRRRRTHDVLLNAGYEIVGERGVHGWPISDVADRADVALGSFYNHFSDREDFIEALVATYILGDQVDRLTQVPRDRGDFALRLALQLADLVDQAIDAPHYRAFAVAVGELNTHKKTELTSEFLAGIEGGRSGGQLSIGDPTIVLAAVRGLVLSVFRHIDSLETSDPGAIDRLGIQCETVRMALALVGASPSRAAEITADVSSGTLGLEAKALRAKMTTTRRGT